MIVILGFSGLVAATVLLVYAIFRAETYYSSFPKCPVCGTRVFVSDDECVEGHKYEQARTGQRW